MVVKPSKRSASVLGDASKNKKKHRCEENTATSNDITSRDKQKKTTAAKKGVKSGKPPKIQNDGDRCVHCGYTYADDDDDPLIDDEWFTCSKCNGWAHESCGTQSTGKQNAFTCHACF